MNRAAHERSRRPWQALLSMRNARRSLAGKVMVVVLVTTMVALATAGTALLITDLRDNRAALADDLLTEAGIVAFAIQPALSFDDRDRASLNLRALQERESISAAAVYTADGAMFARYVRPGHAEPPPRQPSHLEFNQPHIEGSRVLLIRPI